MGHSYYDVINSLNVLLLLLKNDYALMKALGCAVYEYRYNFKPGVVTPVTHDQWVLLYSMGKVNCCVA